MSIRVEEKSKTTPDKADAIRQIDVHTIPVDLVYQRFFTAPTIGLESPAVARLTDTFGKNVISPPKDSVLEEGSQLHIRRVQFSYVDRVHCHNRESHLTLFSIKIIDCSTRLFNFLTSLLENPILKYLIWAYRSF